MGKTIHLILNSPFPNYTGGRETWLYNVASRLATAECPIRIYTTLNDELPQSFQIHNPYVEIDRVTTLFSYRILRIVLRKYLATLDFFAFAFVVFLRLRRYVAAHDIVVTLGPIEESVAVRLLLHIRTCTFVCSVRGFHADVLTRQFPLLRKLWHALEGSGLKKAHRIWCNGYDTLEYVRAMGLAAEVIPNGVDTRHYAQTQSEATREFEQDKVLFSDREKRYIVSTATLLPIKGIKELIDAAFMLKRKGLKCWKIIWLGKGRAAQYIEYAKERGLGGHIVFPGERRDTAPYLQAGDMTVCLSGGGGLSMAVLEAMASGKPIIAWDNAVYRQILRHKESAFLVPEGNSEVLADALVELMEKYESYTYMGTEAQKAVLPYDWNAVVNKVQQEIQAKQVAP